VGQETPQGNGSRPEAASNGHHQVGGYRVLRELETDSLGSVYEAEHPLLHRRVAVRTIGANVARDVSFSRRFLLELRSYVALEHEAIPRLYELAYEGESPYLVTEMVAGKTLDDVFEAGERYEPSGVIALLRPIASALDYAHSRATIHRDVKPANILLADDGRTLSRYRRTGRARLRRARATCRSRGRRSGRCVLARRDPL
jgi:serine/threonine-protein kinase